MSLNKGEIAMDSVQLLEILVAVEQEFGVMFKDTDITPQIFDCVDNFMEFIHGAIAKKEVQ